MNSRRLLYFLCVGIALLAAGCSLAPKYTKPADPIPDEWPTGPAYGNRPASAPARAAALEDWRAFFVSAQMRKVIAVALDNNRDLRVAAFNVEQAQGLYRVQRAALLPHVDAGGGAGKQRLPPVDTMSPQAVTVERYNVNLGISSWEVDFFGRLRSLKTSALEQYLASAEARRNAQIALVAEVADAYLILAADQENLKLAQQTLDSDQASYDLILGRYNAGIASELDLRQAQTPLETARVDIARYTALVAQDVNALNLLVGVPVPAELLPSELAAVGALQDITPNLPSEALAQRPDILQSEHQLKAMNANIGAARAAFFPRIALTTALGTASTNFSGLFDSGKNAAWNYAANVSMPIFDAGANRANLDVALADREIALAQYEKAIQTAFREVADALAEQKPVNDELKAQQSLVDATAASQRLATARYVREVDSYLNVLDAERSLYSAQQGLIAVRLARLTNMVRLYVALGGGA